MYNIIFNKYIILILSIGLLFYVIFKYKTKMKSTDEKFLKLFVFVSLSTGVLIILSQIMGLGNQLLLPIAGCVVIAFVILTIIVWRVRKVPQSRVYCKMYFGVMIFLIIFIIVVIILWKLGLYG